MVAHGNTITIFSVFFLVFIVIYWRESAKKSRPRRPRLPGLAVAQKPFDENNGAVNITLTEADLIEIRTVMAQITVIGDRY